MKRIVIVGEPSELLEFLGHALIQEGYQVRFVHDVLPSVAKAYGIRWNRPVAQPQSHRDRSSNQESLSLDP